MNKFTFSILLLFGMFFGTIANAQIVPVVSWDFNEDEMGWEIIHMSDQTAQGFVWSSNGYWKVPGGTFYYGGSSSDQIKHSWIVSPVIDLTNVTMTELYLTYAYLYGTQGVNIELFIQEDANLDLTLTDVEAFVSQWGDVHTNMDSSENPDLGGNFGNAKVECLTTNPLNMAMHDGKKVRIGIRVHTPAASSGNSRNVSITEIKVAGEIFDETPPVNTVTAIDSIGNTFSRAHLTADEICKVYWAVKTQGESITELADIKDNLGSDAFVSSGTFDYNVPNSSKTFEVADLEINTEYTLFYGAEDFKNNISTISSVDFSSDNDEVAPIISAITLDEIKEVSAMAHVSADIMGDDFGEIMLRVYEAGWEPTSFEQFENGQGSVKNVHAYKVRDFSVPADTILQYFEPDTRYIVYGTVTDLAGNVSEIFKSDYFTTLADDKAPVITSSTITNITNHGGELTLICDEPTAGFGDVIAHWVATTQGTVLTPEQVLSRENGLASGTAKLDSATYDNIIHLDNLDKNTVYTIHCVALDESENVSDVSTIDMTTTNELEEVPLYLQEFNVENQGYHFVDVTAPEGGTGWKSDAGNSRVRVWNSPQARGEFFDSWCIVGPIDLTNVLDIAAEWEGDISYGKYDDKVSLWVTDKYTGNNVVDINDWTQISQAGDFSQASGVQSAKRAVPAELGKDGVYFAFRYYHDVWSLTWNINWLKVYGSRVGEAEAPVIDWVETEDIAGSTSAVMDFTANTYGRAYWYLAEELVEGVAPDAPTIDQVKSGALASAHGFVEYTAGNFIGQKFDLNNLKPNTKYHLYTAFRDLEYNWAEEIFYDSEVCVFETKSLDITTLSSSSILATGVNLDVTALSEGRLYWTVKEQGQPAPTSYDEIYSSFDKKGGVDYTVTDESVVSWYAGGLMPETDYTAYAIMTEGSREHYSAITSVNFTTPAIEVLSITNDHPVLMADETDKYTVTFNVESSSSGWIHLVMTDFGQTQPEMEDILDISAGFGGQKFSIEDPSDIVMQINNLTKAQGDAFTAWAVVTSGDFISPVIRLDYKSTDIENGSTVEDKIKLINEAGGINIVYNGDVKTNVVIYNLAGQIIKTLSVMPSENKFVGLKNGLYILTVNVDGNKVAKRFIVK